jgi:hypothetical protein
MFRQVLAHGFLQAKPFAPDIPLHQRTVNTGFVLDGRKGYIANDPELSRITDLDRVKSLVYRAIRPTDLYVLAISDGI